MMKNTISTERLFFLYDYEMKRFIKKNKDSDFITMTDNLVLSSRRFMWYFDCLRDIGSKLLGYSISKNGEKYIMSIIYDNRTTEFRQDWVLYLGKILSKEYDFKTPLFVSSEDVFGEITSLTFEDLDLTDEGLFV